MASLRDGEGRLEELARHRAKLAERLMAAERRGGASLGDDNPYVLRGELARVDSAIREIAGTN
ncbi:hypothetical protein J4558_19375 [Leptolyngbya sp. 15MV]|jgi:hypothetical protein|nr:hypothetical protein J4558_19375 [Leptolyngbya sp. 15MV]